MNLTDKTVIVSGGARGIGRAIAHACAAAGADVVIGDLRLDQARSTAAEIGNAVGRAVAAVGTDVTQIEQVRHLVQETLQLHGKIDVLVNSAGWDKLQPFLKTTPELWDRVLAINFRGVLHTCHAVLPHMVERKQGAIVNEVPIPPA